MLSRTADHLYWMARYIERAETLAYNITCRQAALAKLGIEQAGLMSGAGHA